MLNKKLVYMLIFAGAVFGSLAFSYALETYYNSESNLEIKFSFIMGSELKTRILNTFPEVIQIKDYTDGTALVINGNARNIERINRVANRLTDVLCMPDSQGNIYSIVISTAGQPVITRNDQRCLQ